eukprot:6201077-Pleurochrysis_carterae.AAC.3
MNGQPFTASADAFFINAASSLLCKPMIRTVDGAMNAESSSVLLPEHVTYTYLLISRSYTVMQTVALASCTSCNDCDQWQCSEY